MRLRWMVTRCSVGLEHAALIAASRSMPRLPLLWRPQPLMSLSSMITSVTLAEMRIASWRAPVSLKPRRITYEALITTLLVAVLLPFSVEPDAAW
jgi:hypothetical protein